MCVCACVFVWVCVCVCECVWVCVCVWVWVGVEVCVWVCGCVGVGVCVWVTVWGAVGSSKNKNTNLKSWGIIIIIIIIIIMITAIIMMITIMIILEHRWRVAPWRGRTGSRTRRRGPAKHGCHILPFRPILWNSYFPSELAKPRRTALNIF